MEFRVIGRGALAGLVAGVLGFVFSRIFAEPVINRAIDYESGRDDVLNGLRHAAGLATEADGPEIFSRTIQSTVGIATGIIGVSISFALLVAVAWLILQPRVQVPARTLVWEIVAVGFLGIFLLPYVKYPSNPPAIGHDFTIQMRGVLYLSMVAVSLLLLVAALVSFHRLAPRWGASRAAIVTVVGFLVVYGLVLAMMPSLGNLPANVQAANDLGFARSATETPQPIYNTLGKTLTLDGMTYKPGQLVYPGFDADVLWKFRWYSLLNQVLIWTSVGLVFGTAMHRFATRYGLEPARQKAVTPATGATASSRA